MLFDLGQLVDGFQSRLTGWRRVCGLDCDRSKSSWFIRLEFCFAKEGPMFTFDKADRRARNMSAMMDRLGLDTDAFAHRRFGLDLNSAIRTCQFCDADEVCRDWLA